MVRQLLDAPLAAMSSAERKRILSGAAGLAAAALSVADTVGERSGDPGSVLHGLYWLVANLATERPLLIVVDDAHWADGASIAFLSYLARRIEGLALLVVYASRIAEGAGDSLPARAEPDLVATVLRPGVLSEPATAKLIERVLGSESSGDFARACGVATGGNPFLLQELLRALRADRIAPSAESCEAVARIVPSTISRAILARLTRLGATATRFAFATAVLGHSAELRHAAALADLEPGAAADAVDALTSACILSDGRPLEFIHPVLRTTVYAEIPSARRAAMHRRAAMLLKLEQVAAAELAPHLMATEPSGDREVVLDLRAAADQVRDRGASDAAWAYLTRALAEPPRPADRAAIQYALGSAGLAAGRAGAMTHLREALSGDLEPPLRLAGGQDFCAGLVASGELEEGIAFLEASAARFAAEGDLERAMQVEGHLLCTAQLHPATASGAYARLARYEVV